jgi:hypothetical protein
MMMMIVNYCCCEGNIKADLKETACERFVLLRLRISEQVNEPSGSIELREFID